MCIQQDIFSIATLKDLNETDLNIFTKGTVSSIRKALKFTASSSTEVSVMRVGPGGSKGNQAEVLKILQTQMKQTTNQIGSMKHDISILSKQSHMRYQVSTAPVTSYAVFYRAITRVNNVLWEYYLPSLPEDLSEFFPNPTTGSKEVSVEDYFTPLLEKLNKNPKCVYASKLKPHKSSIAS